VKAARSAFPAYAAWSVDQRIALLEKIMEVYQKRAGDLSAAVTSEMGAPKGLADGAQVPIGLAHLGEMVRVLKEFKWEKQMGKSRQILEPIGVCGFITPWNWPINQIMCKVVPALGAGCTMILKPTELAPLNAIILAEIFEEAGVPKGVFNLVNGDGPTVGNAMSVHPDIDMMSFTGSTRAGILVSKSAADTVKRVALELGGKSPNILLDDCDLEKAVTAGVVHVMQNTGQSCNAPTRMLVPQDRHAEALGYARAAADSVKTGDPLDPETQMGPQAHRVQWERVQGLIEKGISEGADLVAGGTGRPDGLNRGYYTKPTVFGGVNNDMTIAREEIFGPVVAVLPYKTEEEALEIANDTPYGLSSYIQSGNIDRARNVARQIRAGNVHLNGAGLEFTQPFGGYKQSGNGREWGEHGLVEFLEVKAVMGYGE
jgi:aldehyde dehydrogenase (NAD+)